MIKIFKVIDGSVIIGKLVDETDSHYKIKNNHVLILQQSQSGPVVMLGNLDKIFSDDEDIDLNKASVIAVLNPAKEIEDKYNQSITGIAIPNKKIVGV